MSFPKIPQQQKKEMYSLAIIQKDLKEIGVFRNQTERDFGIDLEIEIENAGHTEGHSVKVQVKSSDDLTIRMDGHATVGGIKQSTLNYWAEISYNIPVIGMAVDLSSVDNDIYVSDLLFWQVIRLIDPSGDKQEYDDKGHVKQPPSKTIDFGNKHDNANSIERIRSYAYGISLRDFITAHKWILRNLKRILSLYGDANWLDFYMPINDPDLFREFLENAKRIVYYDMRLKEVSGTKLDAVFDFGFYERQCNGDDPYNRVVYEGMKPILQKLLLPMLKKYRDLVFDSTYYWSTKDPGYLRLVFETEIPDENNEKVLIDYPENFQKEYGNGKWALFLGDQEKRYGITDNSLFFKLINC